jgi:hypothetical protein
MTSRLFYLLPCLAVAGAVLSACADNFSAPVGVDYRQIGFCNTYATPGGTRASKPDEVYVVYEIDAVDNAKRNSDFVFLPNRLYVDPAEWGATQKPWASKPGEMQDFFAVRDRRRFLSGDASFAQAMGVRTLEPGVISRGAKTNVAAYSIVALPISGEDHADHSYKLSYEPQNGESVDPPVVTNDANAARRTWPHPDNCLELAFDKLPS